MAIRWPLRYTNGNYNVELYKDGTKHRKWPDDVIPKPAYPESLDLLVTTQCQVGCEFCYMSAQKVGRHADLAWLEYVLSGLPAGVEIAIGGGNPLEYPDLIPLLKWCRRRRLVANITVRYNYADARAVKVLQAQELVHGVGLSGWQPMWDQIEKHGLKHVVHHVIVGIDSPWDVMRLLGYLEHTAEPLLVLGYKQTGRAKDTTVNIDAWRYWWSALVEMGQVAFDNLAIEQLGVKGWMIHHGLQRTWDERFMGADGEYSLYLNGVDQAYAINSVSEQVLFGKMNVVEAFRAIQKGVSNV